MERMLVENEKDHGPRLTGIDAEWMLLTERIRAFVQTPAQPVLPRVMTRPHARSLIEPNTGLHRPAQLGGAGNAARHLSDRLRVLLAVAPRNGAGRGQ